ncbi:MAG: ADP-ribosylation factor-like protein [Candidatus Thorarchaeota archaeon]
MSHLIHNTFLIRTGSKEVLASTQYWPVDVDHEALLEFVSTRDEIKNGQDDYTELPLIIDDHKFHGLDWVGDTILVFVTDKGEEEGNIFEKMRDATTALRKELAKSGLEQVIEKYEQIIEPSVTTRLKIALVGEGGVGKTTTLHLLLGDTPPLQYVPTIALNLETVENIRFGNYSLVLWDFAGQERFRNLWKFYFHGADVIFLVCDSTLRNVIISKDILKLIKRDAPKVPVFAMANKQDKPNAMKPEVVQKILGIPTYPMVAIDKARRDEMLRILMTAAAQYVGVALPDLPASELLKFTDAATEEAIAEVEAAAEARAEEAEEEEFEFVEIVEEVYVDDEGHEIELSDEYEIVEETVEEVEEGEAEEPPTEILTEEVAEVSAKSEEPVLPTVEEEIVEAPPEAIPVTPSTDEVPSGVEFSQPSPAFDLPTTGGEEPAPIEVEILDDEVIGMSEPEEFTVPVNEGPAPVLEGGTDNGTQMAREIIFEALEADDMIVAEIEKASREEIDGALEAFACDEVIPRADDPPLSDTIDQDSLDELESILGPLDKSVGGLGASSEDEDQDYLPIDNETLAELSRLLDLQSADDEE